MKGGKNQSYNSYRGWKSFLKSSERKKKAIKIEAGLQVHQFNMNKTAQAKGRTYKFSKKNSFSFKRNRVVKKPDFPVNTKFLTTVSNPFSNKSYNGKDDGIFHVPSTFSLLENYEESFDFLKRLFVILQKGKNQKIILDYNKCYRIDVDASICMDLLLADYINYTNNCRKRGYFITPIMIIPINFEKDHVKKVLYSIGAYKNLQGISIKYDDIEPLPVLINGKDWKDALANSEIHLTEIVEYIKLCLLRLKRELTIEAETEFYKVIGEIMSNAEEHGTLLHRFAIGFFQETHSDSEHFGIFNFTIFNFGDTIYQTFKSPKCLNKKIVAQMNNLSEDYTKKGWLQKADFEEETLWTLYALQEGVTSKEEKRGNGSIQYIENFFKLKGNSENDNVSKLVVVSGNTRIQFDGTYKITTKTKEGQKHKYKMITFNESGEISDKPNKKYVTFAPYFFPGTLISARILIKFNNTTSQTNGNNNI